MTPEAQRIAIAIYCGARWFTRRGDRKNCYLMPFGFDRDQDGWYPSDGPESMEVSVKALICEIPEYMEDLNACREMENTLTDERRAEFREILSDHLGDTCRIGLGFHATATQRAEAFGLTLKLWK